MALALVTGASGAIGGAIARGLAEAGFDLVLPVRDASRAESLPKGLSGQSRSIVIDLSRRASIRAAASEFDEPLDVLVNNASETPRRREETEDGIERQFATNVLGYHWMVESFVDALSRAESPRVVNVASYWAGGLDLGDLEFRRRRYDNDAAYRQSKQAERMLTVAWAERLRSRGIAVNACHPGDVPSRLARSLGFGGHQTAEEAAETPLHLALHDVGTGGYFADSRPATCEFARDRIAIDRLLDVCESFTPV